MNKHIPFISVIIGVIFTIYNNIRLNTDAYLMGDSLEFTQSSIQPTIQDFGFIYLGIFLIIFGVSLILYNLLISTEENKDESNL